MSAENQFVRPELNESQVAVVVHLIDSLFDGTTRTPEQLESAAIALDVASSLCRKAAEIHRGLQVPWPSMCWVCYLPAPISKLPETQPMIEQMLAGLHVDLVKQENPRRGCAMPNFKVAEA